MPLRSAFARAASSSAFVACALFACGQASEAPTREPPSPATPSPSPAVAAAEALDLAHARSPTCAARPVRDVAFARDVEPILMSTCSGEFCHRLTTAARAYAFLVNQPSVECDDARLLVTPGDPDRSYVVDKIQDRNLCAGHPMPRGLSNALTQAEIATITDWICLGAKDD